MKRLLLGVAISSAMGLVGCSGDSHQDIINDSVTPAPLSRIAFDPGNGVLPLPNDLLFNGTPDGTLQIPGEVESGNYLDPQIALGALDGWSTLMPLSIEIIPGSEGVTLDPVSAEAPGSVRVFNVTLGGPLSPDPECTAALLLSICKVGEELMYGTDFVTVASGNSVNVVPIQPLAPVTSYAVITTTQLMDSAGLEIAPSTNYELLKLDINEEPLVTPDQLFLQDLVNNYETSLAAAHSVDKANITYSGVFTTQSVQDVVATTAMLMADGLQPDPQVSVSPLFAPMWSVAPTPIGMTVADRLGLRVADPTCSGQVCALADMADLYTAELRLPYLQAFPVDSDDIAGRWGALGDSPLAVIQALEGDGLSMDGFTAQAQAQGIDPQAALVDPSLLVGGQFVLDTGESAGMPVDVNKHLTRFNPVPNPCGGAALMTCLGGGQIRESVPVLISIPDPIKLAAFYALQGNPNWTPPATGWPVSINLHGLGGTKETTLAVAGAYTAAGIATVSIDMPLHGERSKLLNATTGAFEVSATDSSLNDLFPGFNLFDNGNPLNFVNIASSLTVRDNFRQGIIDNLGLRLALTALVSQQVAMSQAPIFDLSRVSLQGLSLGGIVGTSVTAYANSFDAGESLNPYAFANASLVAPAGGLAGAFAGSAAFRPQLEAELIAQLSIVDPETGISPLVELMMVAAPDCVVDGVLLDIPECDAAVLAALDAVVIPPFALAVQTAVDAMDPINHAAQLVATGAPVHLVEIVGDESLGGTNPGDQTLPNSVTSFPLSGTEPLIAALGLPAVTETTFLSSPERVSGAVRFSKGHHSSLITPDTEISGIDPVESLRATVEMQTQVVEHARTLGRSIKINDPGVILGAQ
ncbi:VolA/Pla-1 family phospholipase [Ferrimonas pelagia]